jgi:hypothetical protein
VSPDFLASDFVHQHELGPLLKEAERGGVKILWVPVRASAYKETALRNYQAVIDSGKPLAGMTPANRDRAWVKICEEIKKALNPSKEPFPEDSLKDAAPRSALTFAQDETEKPTVRPKVENGGQSTQFHDDSLVPIPLPRGSANDLFRLEQALGPEGSAVIKAIHKAGKIVFHVVSDTGSAQSPRNQRLVADAILAQCQESDVADSPSFMFHLGDVVYPFGEAKSYYDQFYKPYRDYPGPIFAIPGDRDAMVLPGETHPVLHGFLCHFCTPSPRNSKYAGGLNFRTMTQPGVYFTLDAPFLRIIGLFSDALDHPGVISSQAGRYPSVSDHQLSFLQTQLIRINKERYPGAVLLAVHHPAFSWAPRDVSDSSPSGSSLEMFDEIERVCQMVDVYPHAFLSGHVHNYQRYMLHLSHPSRNIPFFVCGCGGHDIDPLVKKHVLPPKWPEAADHIRADLLLAAYYENFGFLRVTVDSDTLQIEFHDTEARGARDTLQGRV